MGCRWWKVYTAGKAAIIVAYTRYNTTPHQRECSSFPTVQKMQNERCKMSGVTMQDAQRRKCWKVKYSTVVFPIRGKLFPITTESCAYELPNRVMTDLAKTVYSLDANTQSHFIKEARIMINLSGFILLSLRFRLRSHHFSAYTEQTDLADLALRQRMLQPEPGIYVIFFCF